MPPLIIVIVTCGLAFVVFAALAAGLTTELSSVVTPLRGRGRSVLGVLVANFVVVPVLVGLSLAAFGFVAQATMAFALLSVVAGAPFVAMFTGLGRGDAAYATSVSLLQVLLTIPFLPLVLPWMLDVLAVPHAGVTTWHLLKPLLWFILLPLALGLVVRWRYPAVARALAPHLGQVGLVAIVLHIILMFVAFWDDVVTELGTGEYVYSVLLPFGCLAVGYGVCLLAAGGPARAHGVLLAGSLATAQKGSQALICSLIFAMGTYSVAGVVALGSSVITVVVLVVVAAEVGRHRDRQAARAGATATGDGVSPPERAGAAPRG
ncbi:bile acid:sodium symporter family protein [Actinomycetospora sp. C-140]